MCQGVSVCPSICMSVSRQARDDYVDPYVAHLDQTSRWGWREVGLYFCCCYCRRRRRRCCCSLFPFLKLFLFDWFGLIALLWYAFQCSCSCSCLLVCLFVCLFVFVCFFVSLFACLLA